MKTMNRKNYHTTQVVCLCGSSFTTKMVSEESVVIVDNCNQCHVFYNNTNKAQKQSTAIESFKRRYG